MAALRESAEVLYAGELEIRLGEGLVLASGQALTLSVREFELPGAMARRIGAIVTRDELYEAVWGRDLRAGDRSVDAYVASCGPSWRRRCPTGGSFTPIPASATASKPSPRRGRRRARRRRR